MCEIETNSEGCKLSSQELDNEPLAGAESMLADKSGIIEGRSEIDNCMDD